MIVKLKKDQKSSLKDQKWSKLLKSQMPHLFFCMSTNVSTMKKNAGTEKWHAPEEFVIPGN